MTATTADARSFIDVPHAVAIMALAATPSAGSLDP